MREIPNPPRWRGFAWLVFAAFAVHNVEEAAAMPAYAARMAGRLPLPHPAAYAAVVAAVTLAGLAATIVAVRRDRPRLVGLLAIIMLVNVLVPHVPAALFSGGYAPGVVTAVLLNLPIDAGYLWQLHRFRR